MKPAMTKLLVFGLAAAGFAACTTLPAEPVSPTFAADVQPIFAAHCTRCHGGGGMLRKEVDAASPAGVIECYLDQMEDRGDCSLVDGGFPLLTQCMPGARFCATVPLPMSMPPTTLFDLFFFGAVGTDRRMPPPPAAELNDWEMNTIRRWIAAGGPS